MQNPPTHSYKVCPACGQHLALYMQQCGRCRTLQSPSVMSDPATAVVQGTAPAPNVVVARNAKRPTNFLDMSIGFILGAFVMMCVWVFVMIAEPNKPTPDVHPQDELSLNSDNEEVPTDEINPGIIRNGGERSEAAAERFMIENRSAVSVPSATGSTYVSGHYRTNHSGTTSYVHGHSRR